MAARSLTLMLPAAGLLLAGCASSSLDLSRGPSDAQVLAAVSLTEEDASDTAAFQPYEGADEVAGQVSLDLCSAQFPSEALRVGRRQVAVGSPTSAEWVSSEAILYGTPGEAEQAMAELAGAAGSCPEAPVPPQQGDEPSRAWVFGPSPDADWEDEPGVARQAYAFTVTDAGDDARPSSAIYLQRGRMILALYSTPPGAAASVIRNAPDPQRFTQVMTRRLLAVPDESLQSGTAVPPGGAGLDT